MLGTVNCKLSSTVISIVQHVC